MTDELKKFLLEFMIPAEAVYAKGHNGDNNYIIIENVAGDSGGRTYAGIDETSHPDFDFGNPSLDKALAVYEEEWITDGCDKMSAPFSYVFFDCCVNAGIGRAKKIAAKTGQNASKFLDERKAFYIRLADSKPSLKKFKTGWCNRVQNIRTYLHL